jgi:hypothetical protein
MSLGIKPDKFQLQSPFETRVKEKAAEKGNSEEEIILNSIASSDGWKVLTDEMDAIIEELEGSLSAQMEAGADFDSIGKTAVVKEIVKSYIVRIKRKVSDARDAVRNE